ncbi:class GN sortase [Shewanella sp. SM34]|uniref:class GN sortase n=1 Tax=unclassified Shewanella TaxID=196818 RepID=UPI0021D904FB|nr:MULTISPECIES: class GN sortase [unclassified Shewanella]MCU8055990.1 class GN sortase [Shewanella sp. SM35]MCU8064924.1 class GN sortase [Shewanella sp. SM34]
MSKRRTQRFLVVGLFLIGATLLGKGLYMQAKAHFAQYLIEQAWTKTLADGQSHKPWSWADTYPVAKLSIYREQAAANSDIEAELHDSLYVLAGASGRNLAFGPSLVLSSAPAGQKGNTVIAGHRDTHFAILNGMAVGRRLSLQTLKGNHIIYEVVATQVVHETETQFMAPSDDNRLTLITCYPFDSLQGGAELRFVVQAIPVENESMETLGTNASVSIGSGVQGNIGTVSRSFKH